MQFGTPENLRQFVAAAHALGLACVIDWVPNHMFDSSVLRSFDTTAQEQGPYFYSNEKLRATPYGPRLDCARAEVCPCSLFSICFLSFHHLLHYRAPSSSTQHPCRLMMIKLTQVQEYLLRSAKAWLEEYGFDGVSLTQTHVTLCPRIVLTRAICAADI